MLRAVVVDDDESFLKFVTFALVKNQFQVTALASGRELLKHLLEAEPDILFLDRCLPDASGFALAEKIKLRFPRILLVMFSTLGDASDVIEGLELGADEYLPKPFSEDMLMARVKALLRRCHPRESLLQLGPLCLDKGHHRVTLHGAELTLTKTEFQLLALLMETDQRTVSYEEILKDVLGYRGDQEEAQRNIFFHIAGLRKKLGGFRKNLKTVRGFGYRLVSGPL